VTLLLELQATYVVPWDTVLSKTPLETGAIKKLKLLRSKAGISTVVQAHEKMEQCRFDIYGRSKLPSLCGNSIIAVPSFAFAHRWLSHVIVVSIHKTTSTAL